MTSPPVKLKANSTPKEASIPNRVKSVIRTFFRWCEHTGLVERNPAAHIRLGAAPLPATRHMTRGELERFLRTIRQGRHPLRPCDHAPFASLVYTGSRLSEIIRFRRSHVELAPRRLVLAQTK